MEGPAEGREKGWKDGRKEEGRGKEREGQKSRIEVDSILNILLV